MGTMRASLTPTPGIGETTHSASTTSFVERLRAKKAGTAIWQIPAVKDTSMPSPYTHPEVCTRGRIGALLFNFEKTSPAHILLPISTDRTEKDNINKKMKTHNIKSVKNSSSFDILYTMKVSLSRTEAICQKKIVSAKCIGSISYT